MSSGLRSTMIARSQLSRGIWTEFKGERGTKSKPIPGPHLVYGFLTTAPNAVVKPIHLKAMPVILTTEEEREADKLAYFYRRGRSSAAVLRLPSPIRSKSRTVPTDY